MGATFSSVDARFATVLDTVWAAKQTRCTLLLRLYKPTIQAAMLGDQSKLGFGENLTRPFPIRENRAATLLLFARQ